MRIGLASVTGSLAFVFDTISLTKGAIKPMRGIGLNVHSAIHTGDVSFTHPATNESAIARGQSPWDRAAAERMLIAMAGSDTSTGLTPVIPDRLTNITPAASDAAHPYPIAMPHQKQPSMDTGIEIEVVRPHSDRIIIRYNDDTYNLIGDNYIYFNWWFEKID